MNWKVKPLSCHSNISAEILCRPCPKFELINSNVLNSELYQVELSLYGPQMLQFEDCEITSCDGRVNGSGIREDML